MYNEEVMATLNADHIIIVQRTTTGMYEKIESGVQKTPLNHQTETWYC